MANEFKSFYKEVGGNEGDKCRYKTRLDTYGCGCQYDCSYCYAKSLLNFRNLWDSTNPSVAEYNKTTDSANKTVACLMKIIRNFNVEDSNDDENPLLKMINGSDGDES